MQMNREAIDRFIEDAREDLLSDLAALVAVDSVRSAPLPGKPFGAGPAAALETAAELLRRRGFAPHNIDNYALEADLGDDPALMLLAHLDVVDAGDGWHFPPFAMTRQGDTLYGRGVTDDKGPAVACLYAMLACRAVYGAPKRGVRLVLGSAEETGSEDMEHYFSRRPYLPYTLSPDADYPLINIEKGRFAPFFTGAFDNAGDAVITRIEGGGTQNIVPGKARACLHGLSEETVKAAAAAASPATGAAFEVRAAAQGTEIFVKGQTAHAAMPEKGCNAQTALLSLLCSLPLTENEAFSALKALNRLFPHGDTAGAAAGVAMEDAVSGALTLNFGVLQFEDGAFRCGVDIRSPLGGTEENVAQALRRRLAAAGFAFEGACRMTPVHYVPEDSLLVRELLSVYEARTGEKGKCLAIGGGTYVHEIEGGVAFGVEFPGRDYRIHGADETADVNELLLTAKMYADVICRLCY